jgi:hypothetical protein
MLFGVTVTNFADRGAISIAGPEISKALHLSPVQMGYIFSAFAWSYVLAQLPGGWLLDTFGSKRVIIVSLTTWSLFTMFQGALGFLTGGLAVAGFFILRFLVGAAEAPSFPGNGRITSAWFPASERGFASAIFNAAQYFAVDRQFRCGPGFRGHQCGGGALHHGVRRRRHPPRGVEEVAASGCHGLINAPVIAATRRLRCLSPTTTTAARSARQGPFS